MDIDSDNDVEHILPLLEQNPSSSASKDTTGRCNAGAAVDAIRTATSRTWEVTGVLWEGGDVLECSADQKLRGEGCVKAVGWGGVGWLDVAVVVSGG